MALPPNPRPPGDRTRLAIPASADEPEAYTAEQREADFKRLSRYVDDCREAQSLLGFALFNHYKGKHEASATLMRKAYKLLAGKEWDSE